MIFNQFIFVGSNTLLGSDVYIIKYLYKECSSYISRDPKFIFIPSRIFGKKITQKYSNGVMISSYKNKRGNILHKEHNYLYY